MCIRDRGYALTDAGQAMIAYIERMAEEADALRRGLADGDRVPRGCLLYTSPSPRDRTRSRMPSSA